MITPNGALNFPQALDLVVSPCSMVNS